jgi:hypothetical protein
MVQTTCLVLIGLFLFSVAPLNAGPPPVPGAVEITLGQSVVPLYGPWKFTVGDSPIDAKTGKPQWAEPDFDDSKWETVDLAPGTKATNPARYLGWAWYRLRLKVNAKPGDQMAIDGPISADDTWQFFDAWQFFVGGKLIGSFGKFDSRGNVQRICDPRPLMFPLAPVKSSEYGALIETLAFRVWMGPGGVANPNVGGLHYPPMLVLGSAAAAQSRLDWQEWLIRKVDEAAYIALFLILAVLSASLMLFDRSDRVYLWIAATMLVAPIGYILVNVCATTTWLDSRVIDILIGPNDAFWAAGWVMVWWVWFRFRRPAWVPRAILVLLICLAAVDALKPGLRDYGIALPHGRNAALLNALVATSLVFRLLFVLAIALVVVKAIRKEGKEGWFALPAVAALAAEMTAEAFGVDVVGRSHGMNVQIWDLTDPLLVAVLVFLMLRRLLQSLERQRQMALDVKQAQEVQQVILPEPRTTLPGLVIESEYRPAREVGGDFFQIIPQASDGSLLIVAGDVSGKGLKAGMLVALLVGAIRTAADSDSSPEFILDALNRRLLWRGDALATCAAMRIEHEGSVTLANAGHLPPYLNGIPVEIEGSLPLGLLEQLECSVHHFFMTETDRLLLLSDGVVEATNKEGKLFGFERVLELVRTESTAAKIAETAQAFGQEDDITVIAVTKIAIVEPAMARA